jgi:tRNA(fMet)-specific endonuclease VapC
MKYILDTNIRIYIIKRKPQAVIERFIQTEISQIGISSISLSNSIMVSQKVQNPNKI